LHEYVFFLHIFTKKFFVRFCLSEKYWSKWLSAMRDGVKLTLPGDFLILRFQIKTSHLSPLFAPDSYFGYDCSMVGINAGNPCTVHMQPCVLPGVVRAGKSSSAGYPPPPHPADNHWPHRTSVYVFFGSIRTFNWEDISSQSL
jgi:hypothetical protein